MTKIQTCTSGDATKFVDSAVPALASGAVQSVFFNPVDRALFLRVHHLRPFFHPDNWRNPFQGFGNAAAYRTLCSASYLFWQDTSKGYIDKHYSHLNLNPAGVQLAIGLAAGTCNGLALNQLQIVKYRMWSDGHGTFWSHSSRMLAEAGPKIFFRGIGVSIGRDSVFGVVYEVCRMPHIANELGGSSVQFVFNMVAAVLACVISSPLNYCRNVIYGAPPQNCPLRVNQLIHFMFLEAAKQPTWKATFAHINVRCNIGWGSVRVGVGMGVGQYCFRFFQNMMCSIEDQVGSGDRKKPSTSSNE